MRIYLTGRSQSDLRNPDLTVFISRCVQGEPVFSPDLVAFLIRAVIHYWWSVQLAGGRGEGAAVPVQGCCKPRAGTKASGDISRWVTSLGKHFGWFAVCSQCLDWRSETIPYLWASTQGFWVSGNIQDFVFASGTAGVNDHVWSWCHQLKNVSGGRCKLWGQKTQCLRQLDMVRS